MTQSDMGKTLGEIAKVDPHFTKEAFMIDLQFDIIPTVLEVSPHLSNSVIILCTYVFLKAFLKGKIDVLQDWCHEAVSQYTTHTHTRTHVHIHTQCILKCLWNVNFANFVYNRVVLYSEVLTVVC